MRWSKIKAHCNNKHFVKTFAFVIVDQTTSNCFSNLMVCFLINNLIVNDIGCCLLRVWFFPFHCRSSVHRLK